MPNVLVLAKDDRVRRQIELLLTELDVADVRFATFKTFSEFQQIYFREEEVTITEAPPPAPEPETETEGAELKMFSEIHLLIFALDSVNDKLAPWIDTLWASVKKFKRAPTEGQMRLVLLKYEDDGISKLDVMHTHLDDLVYLPIDRLIFLQKLQIFLSLPKRVSPTYLFNQEVKKQIEISKIAKLDRLSDVALAIRNPVPLKKGLPSHFYVTFPGEKRRLELHAKVLRSIPHPDHKGQHLVYFTYFGLPKLGLSLIRRTLSKSPQYKSFRSDDRERFRYRPDDLFAQNTERRMIGTVVIDSDEVTGNALGLTLTNEMDRLNVACESSYSLFLYRYLNTGGGADRDTTPPKATDVSDFYNPRISLTLSAADLKVLSVDPGPLDTSLFLGHSASQIFSSPEKWISLIQEKASRAVMEEAAQLVSKGRTLEKLLVMQDVNNQRCAVLSRIYRGAADGLVCVDLAPASLSDILAKLSTENIAREVEAMIVDTAFLPEDPSGWIEGLRQRAAQVGLVKDPALLKFWLISDTEAINPNFLKFPDLLGLYIKPIDQRQLLFSMSEHLPNKNTMYNFDNLDWSQPGISIHVSKEIDLEALSEFGATLKSKQKILPGNIIYLRRSIYENAPNGCLAARVYSCEEDPNEKGSYIVYTTYFGINDAFLKFARTWIRENYAQQKSQGS